MPSAQPNAQFKFDQNIDTVMIYKKNQQISPLALPLLVGSPQNMTIYTISQSLTLSNFFHKTPGKFKFSHNIGRVELYPKKFTTFFHLSLPPLGSPQKFDYSLNYTIFDAVQLFPQDTWEIQIWPQHR